MSGDVQALQQLLEVTNSSSNTVEVLYGEVNEEGYTMLHLAAASGHVEVVRFLLEFGGKHGLSDEEMCTKVGKNNTNALHLATISGQVDVIKLLLDVWDGAVMGVTEYDETVLHLAVKHGRYDAFDVFIGRWESFPYLHNFQDCQGNTVLHLATAKRDFRVIRQLVMKPDLDVNKKNAYDLTPLDIIFMCAINPNDLYIVREIHSAGGKLTSEARNSSTPPRVKNVEKSKQELIQEMVSGILIMASIIATVTFQVAMTPPGGFIQNNTNTTSSVGGQQINTNPGRAVLYYFAHDKYATLMITNANTFMASILVIISLIQPSKFLHLVWPKVRFFLNLTVVLVTVEFFLILSIANDGKLLQRRGFLATIGLWGTLLGATVLSLFFQSTKHYMRFCKFDCGGIEFAI